MQSRWLLFVILAVMGAGWGVTQPLAKIAVSEGYRAFGLIAWQLAIGAMATGACLVIYLVIGTPWLMLVLD